MLPDDDNSGIISTLSTSNQDIQNKGGSQQIDEKVIEVKLDWITRDKKGSFTSTSNQGSVVDGTYTNVQPPGSVPPVTTVEKNKVDKKSDQQSVESLFDDRRWVQFLYNKDPDKEFERMEELKRQQNRQEDSPGNKTVKAKLKSGGLGIGNMFSNVSRGMFNLFPTMKSNPYTTITTNNIAKKAHNQCVFSTQVLERSLNTLSESKDASERATAINRVRNSLDSIQGNLSQLKDIKKTQLNQELKHKMKHFQNELNNKHSPIHRANKVLKNSVPGSTFKQINKMINSLLRSIKNMLSKMVGLNPAPGIS